MELAFEARYGSLAHFANHLVFLGPRNLQPGVRSKFFDVRVEGPDTMATWNEGTRFSVSAGRAKNRRVPTV